MAKNTLDETREIKVLLSQIKGFCDTIHDILHNSTAAEIGRYSSYRDMACIYNDFAEQVRRVLKVSSMIYTFNIDQFPKYGDAVWGVEKKLLEQVYVSAKMLLSSLEGSLDFVDDEFDNIENFFSSRLRTVIFSKPEKEVEVQKPIMIRPPFPQRLEKTKKNDEEREILETFRKVEVNIPLLDAINKYRITLSS